MLNAILAYLGLSIVNLDSVARRLAGDMLRVWGSDVDTLAPSTGKQELQRKYMEMAMATGLPGGIARQVANRAWRYIVQAQQVPIIERDGFSFYE